MLALIEKLSLSPLQGGAAEALQAAASSWAAQVPGRVRRARTPGGLRAPGSAVLTLTCRPPRPT